MAARTTFVLVTYNSGDIIDRSLGSVQPARDAGVADCIVVDNGGGDIVTHIRRYYPWVTVIESGGNIGFGRGCNLGLRYVHTPYVTFMNPDASIGLEALEKLIVFLDTHPKAAIAAPAIVQDDGELQVAGGLPTPAKVVSDALGLAQLHDRVIEPNRPPFETDWLSGALLVARKEVIDRLGGFDSRFFLYFEETDLCKRVRDHGGQLWAVGEAVACHLKSHSASSTQKTMFEGCIAEHYFPSRLYYLVKHYGWPRAVIAELGELVGLALRDASRLIRLNRKSLLAARLRAPVLRLPAKAD